MSEPTVDYRQEKAITVAGILLVLVSAWVFIYMNVYGILLLVDDGGFGDAVEQGIFLAIAVSLLYGAFIYLLMRLGNLDRFARRSQNSPHELGERFFGNGRAPSLHILIPSYKEERTTIFMTLASAALLEYPHKHVTLLIDDPSPKSDVDRLLHREARELPLILQQMLDVQHAVVRAQYDAFTNRMERMQAS